MKRRPPLVHLRSQIAAHQAEPVAVGQRLVRPVHAGDRVLAVHDGRQGAFQSHVRDAGRIVLTDRVLPVDANDRAQPVPLQHHARGRIGLTHVALELRRIGQRHHPVLARHPLQRAAADAVAGQVGMARPLHRRDLVQDRLGGGDHARPAGGVVLPRGRSVAQRVGAVERVVERAPAGVGGVDRVARVGHRHHELRPGHLGDLGIGAGRVDLEVRPLRHEVADLAQERRNRPRHRAAGRAARGARRRCGPASSRGSSAARRCAAPGPAGARPARTRTPPAPRRCRAAPRPPETRAAPPRPPAPRPRPAQPSQPPSAISLVSAL